MHIHLDRRELVIITVLLWKALLLGFAKLPVPANDAFFYDGPVVNWLLHGSYTNPSLALALPIAGTEIFSAYPPLYQAVLLPWMALFGTSAYVAMWLHYLLFAVYAVGVLTLFLHLKVPRWIRNVAALFLFGITFHDRPDSLAHALGIWAVVCWAKGTCLRQNAGATRRWLWAGAALGVLSLCTSLQVGGVYLLIGWTGLTLRRMLLSARTDGRPWALTVVGPAVLGAMVVFGFPHLWAGFVEHASTTPSYTGLRVPAMGDLLKVIRNVPGILLVLAATTVWLTRCRAAVKQHPAEFALLSAVLVPATVVIGACLFALTPNLVAIANYLQPVVVGLFLYWLTTARELQPPDVTKRRRLRWACSGVFVAAALLVSIRAVGISTWGLSCVGDVSYRTALQRVDDEIARSADGATILFSSAYLYEAANQERVRWIHSDWPGSITSTARRSELEALMDLKPTAIVLTQFDYFRRYEKLIIALQERPEDVEVDFDNTAMVPAPDAIPSLRRVVQHVSWAPVVIRLQWKESNESQDNS